MRSAGRLRPRWRRLPDGVSSSLVFVVIAEGGVQAVVSGVEPARSVSDFLEVGPFGFDVAEQGLDPCLVSRGAGPAEARRDGARARNSLVVPSPDMATLSLCRGRGRLGGPRRRATALGVEGFEDDLDLGGLLAVTRVASFAGDDVEDGVGDPAGSGEVLCRRSRSGGVHLRPARHGGAAGGANRPRPAKPQLGRLVELAHMPERERPQKRPRSRAPRPAGPVSGHHDAKGSTAAAEPDRSRCTSSMQHPPTSIDATKDSTLRPAPEPADPPGRTVSPRIDQRLQTQSRHHRARRAPHRRAPSTSRAALQPSKDPPVSDRTHPCLQPCRTSESRSSVISATYAAPTDHARTSASSAALSNWRTCLERERPQKRPRSGPTTERPCVDTNASHSPNVRRPFSSIPPDAEVPDPHILPQEAHAHPLRLTAPVDSGLA